MADFVAVIRRAVDGLATNTPEARVRVYEKARGAVQRQLENMKPRPPEEMLRRQMDKLEAAIAEVETEHAEALPSEAAAPVPAEIYEAPAPHAEPEYVEADASPEPEVPAPATEPVVTDEERAPETYAAPEPYEQPVEHEAVAAESQAEEEWRREPEVDAVEPVQHHWSEPEAVEPVSEEPKAERYGDWRDEVPEGEPAFASAEEPQRDAHLYDHEDLTAQPVEGHDETAQEPVHHVFDEERREQTAAAEHDNVLSWPNPEHDHADHHRHEEQAPETAAAEQWDWSNKSEPEPVANDGRAAAAWDSVDELVQPFTQTQSSEHVDAHFSPEMRASAEPVRMPAASDIPDLSQPASPAKEEDPFEAYVNAQPSASEPVAGAAAKPDDRDPWSDLEDLIGYTKEAPATVEPGKQQAKASEDDLSDLLAPPAKPYRVNPVRKRNYAGIILTLVGLLLLAGGGYALWLNRDSLSDMVGGLIEFGTNETAEQGSTTGESTGQATPSQPAQSTPPAQSTTPPATPTAPANQSQNTPPPADGSSSAGKFTQRLMQDGSETDAGPGDAGSLAQNAEGQSVSQLNAPPANPGPTAPTDGATAGAAAAQTPVPNAPATPSATPSEAPAAAGERMFLYEERIGQSAPTAIEGTVSWSLQREAPQGGGAPEPMVQGRITVPGRGLTALLTLKRNTDSSLPASHLIEIVFAVPPDFEGGAIDSVLRIAMKQTEQDRGNALVAVPAKITDDFHMIALNDFPDARATNLELLRTRDWIDIPVAYRNGRRALLTLQKGPDGKAAFDEAIREWSQQNGTPNGQ
jgi:hypothetical protein